MVSQLRAAIVFLCALTILAGMVLLWILGAVFGV